MRTRRLFLSLLLPLLLTHGCTGPQDPDGPTGVGPDGLEPALPADFVPTPGSELERRLEGECIPYDPFDDGVDNPVCLMSTPQDGTLGRLSAEGEELPGADEDDDVGGAHGALLDEAPAPLPSRVDHRAQYLDGCVSVSNQQACGWCAVHAATAVLEALHCSKGCDVPELSEPHLRSRSRGGRPFEGCDRGWHISAPWDGLIDNASALDTLVDSPIVDAETWPYVANGRGLNASRPDDGTLASGSVHRATAKHNVDADDPEDLKQVLATEREIMISVPVYRRNPRAEDAAPEDRNDWRSDVANVRPPPLDGIIDSVFGPCSCKRSSCTDAMCLSGYHAVVLVGYDDASREFTFLNSWGKNWGDSGYGRMSYEFIEGYGRSAGYLEDVDTSISGNACEDDVPADGGTPEPGDAGAGTADTGMPGGGSTDGGPGTGGIVDRCSRNADCASCVGASGCGWCDGSCAAGNAAGPSGGSCSDWQYLACSATDPCAARADCGSCAGADGCAWCAGGRTADGSWTRGSCFTPGSHTVSCYDPRNAPDQCADCGAIADCSTCSETTGCGWCDDSSTGVVAPGARPGACVGGTSEHPDRVSCGDYVGDGEPCSGDDCARLTDCAACTESEYCGWCDSSDTCMAGGYSGPVSGSSCGGDWDHFGLWCDNTEATCESATSCGECLGGGLMSTGCQWCGSSNSCTGSEGACEGSITDGGMCPAACGGDYAQCGSSEECCEGLECVNGDCVACDGSGHLGVACDPTEPTSCCGTLTCSITGGSDRCCARDEDPCSGDGDCCGEMTCNGGRCSCRGAGESCSTGMECCGGSICVEGSCT